MAWSQSSRVTAIIPASRRRTCSPGSRRYANIALTSRTVTLAVWHAGSISPSAVFAATSISDESCGEQAEAIDRTGPFRAVEIFKAHRPFRVVCRAAIRTASDNPPIALGHSPGKPGNTRADMRGRCLPHSRDSPVRTAPASSRIYVLHLNMSTTQLGHVFIKGGGGQLVRVAQPRSAGQVGKRCPPPASPGPDTSRWS